MRLSFRHGTLLAVTAAFALFNRCASADPNFVNPTTSQQWNGFTSPAGPNPPTSVNNPNGTPTWVDTTAATDGAFDIGAPGSAHIYSPTGMPKIQITIPTANLGTNWVTNLVLQVETEGNELDPNSFLAAPMGLTGVVPTSITKNVGEANGPGGFTEDWVVLWKDLPSAAKYTLNYAAGGTSVSEAAAQVDTQSIPAPEPGSIGMAVVGMGAVLLRRRGRKAR